MFSNKNLIIVLGAIIVLLILGGGAYLYLPKTNVKVTQNSMEPRQSPKASPSGIAGTLKSLLSGGKTETCTIIYPDNQGKGTVYVADKKFAGNFTMNETNGATVTGNTVSDGTYIYIWSSGTTTGIKIKLDAVTNQATQSAKVGNVNFNQEVNLDCSNWTVDNSKFTIPGNITFTDMTNFLAQPSEATKSSNTASPCDQITNATAKAACLNALKQSGQ